MLEPDTHVALANAAALVNTLPSTEGTLQRRDLLPDEAALRTFLDEWAWSNVPPLTPEVLRHVRDLRPRLRELWVAAPTPQRPGQQGPSGQVVQVQRVNALLVQYRALPRLVWHEPYGWHVHATDDEAPLHHRMAVEAAMAMVDLVRAGEAQRLRLCASADCDRVLVDLSRNRSKIYCDETCANRAHAAAYRARRA